MPNHKQEPLADEEVSLSFEDACIAIPGVLVLLFSFALLFLTVQSHLNGHAYVDLLAVTTANDKSPGIDMPSPWPDVPRVDPDNGSPNDETMQGIIVTAIVETINFCLRMAGLFFIVSILLFLFAQWLSRVEKSCRKKKKKKWWQKLLCVLVSIIKWVTIITAIICLIVAIVLAIYCIWVLLHLL